MSRRANAFLALVLCVAAANAASRAISAQSPPPATTLPGVHADLAPVEVTTGPPASNGHILNQLGEWRLVSRQSRPSAPSSGLGLNSLGMRFVQIPAGRFEMGSTIGPGEHPVHPVTIASFWMGVTEVTQAQWQAVMGSNPSHFQQAGPNAPVEMVSWSDAQAFIARLNAREPDRQYRLPSEAEWEYACRVGRKEDPYAPVEEAAWVKENSGGTTHPVGLKRPNGYGLYDMFGNVAEWCEDTYYPSHEGAPRDGSARKGDAAAYHTLRGGGWDLPAFFIHAALRGPYSEIHRLGFRLACGPRRP
jgi:formylglycine-generating enzyme required for sulfatase activity